MLKIKILKIEMYIPLHGSCGTVLVRSITEVTDTILTIGLVKLVTSVQLSH